MDGVESLQKALNEARAVVESTQGEFQKVEAEREKAALALLDANERLMRIERAISVLTDPLEKDKAPEESQDATQPAEPEAAEQAAAPPPPPKPQAPQGPYAQLKCSGCQSVGKMSETHRPTKNGTIVRLLVCGTCSNEVYMG